MASPIYNDINGDKLNRGKASLCQAIKKSTIFNTGVSFTKGRFSLSTCCNNTVEHEDDRDSFSSVSDTDSQLAYSTDEDSESDKSTAIDTTTSDQSNMEDCFSIETSVHTKKNIFTTNALIENIADLKIYEDVSRTEVMPSICRLLNNTHVCDITPPNYDVVIVTIVFCFNRESPLLRRAIGRTIIIPQQRPSVARFLSTKNKKMFRLYLEEEVRNDINNIMDLYFETRRNVVVKFLCSPRNKQRLSGRSFVTYLKAIKNAHVINVSQFDFSELQVKTDLYDIKSNRTACKRINNCLADLLAEYQRAPESVYSVSVNTLELITYNSTQSQLRTIVQNSCVINFGFKKLSDYYFFNTLTVCSLVLSPIRSVLPVFFSNKNNQAQLHKFAPLQCASTDDLLTVTDSTSSVDDSCASSGCVTSPRSEENLSYRPPIYDPLTHLRDVRIILITLKGYYYGHSFYSMSTELRLRFGRDYLRKLSGEKNTVHKKILEFTRRYIGAMSDERLVKEQFSLKMKLRRIESLSGIDTELIYDEYIFLEPEAKNNLSLVEYNSQLLLRHCMLQLR